MEAIWCYDYNCLCFLILSSSSGSFLLLFLLNVSKTHRALEVYTVEMLVKAVAVPEVRLLGWRRQQRPWVSLPPARSASTDSPSSICQPFPETICKSFPGDFRELHIYPPATRWQATRCSFFPSKVLTAVIKDPLLSPSIYSL